MPDPGWLLSQLSNPRNVFDILVVALIIYWLLWVAQGTRATQLIRGIVTLLAVVFLVGTTFQLTALNWVLGQTWPVLLISLPVIFQPEIRRALEQLGQTRSWLPQLRPRPDEMAGRTVDELVKAVDPTGAAPLRGADRAGAGNRTAELCRARRPNRWAADAATPDQPLLPQLPAA